MGIQPIDLQTMYSQASNVSKTLSGHQQAQLTEAMQQQNNIQKNLENSAKVQQTSGDKNNANSVNSNGRNGSGTYQNQKKKSDKEPEVEDLVGNKNQEEHKSSSSPYLGTIIDITR